MIEWRNRKEREREIEIARRAALAQAVSEPQLQVSEGLSQGLRARLTRPGAPWGVRPEYRHRVLTAGAQGRRGGFSADAICRH